MYLKAILMDGEGRLRETYAAKFQTSQEMRAFAEGMLYGMNDLGGGLGRIFCLERPDGVCPNESDLFLFTRGTLGRTLYMGHPLYGKALALLNTIFPETKKDPSLTESGEDKHRIVQDGHGFGHMEFPDEGTM